MSSGSAASTTIGWDTSLSSSQTWSSPLPDSDAAMAAEPSSGIERTREIKVDANDYSRFKDIGKEEEAQENAVKAVSVAPTPAASETCRNCHKTGAKLKCSVCKKAAYCARTCQASDWKFHKRICKKPEVKKPDSPPRRPTSSSSDNAAKPAASSATSSPSTSSSATSTKATTSSMAKKSTSSSSSTEVVVDDPDLPAADLRGYKNGMPYFHRELSEKEQSLIGDIAPKKVEVAPAVDKPMEHHGSAWNSAGTFEERNFTKWGEQKWSELYTGATYTENEYVVTLKEPEKVTGDASICVVRGKKRYLFDFTFKLPFEVAVGGQKYKGSYQMTEISNDEDYEISCQLTATATKSPHGPALQKFVGTRNSGLQKEVIRLIGDFVRDFHSQ